MVFSDIPKEYTSYEKAAIVLLPVSFDATSTWIKGADKGPQAILDASINIELYDIETKSQVFKKGIFIANTIENISTPEELSDIVRKSIDSYISENKFIVTIGGNHSVSIGAFNAFSNRYKDLTILQLDAHADLRPEYMGSSFNHACVMHHAKELCPILQVGIRSMCEEEKYYLNEEKTVFAHEIVNNPKWENKVLRHLGPNVYLTIDLDVFDPSIIPSTGTPEPGGMHYWQVMNFLKKVIRKSNIVGFDVVELCPIAENKAPDTIVSKLIYQLLSYIFYKDNL